MLSQKQNKVLCINDNEITLFILKRILDKAKFSEDVIMASDGWKALTYCKQLIKDSTESEYTYPDIIFLDLHMPVMDGWEFLDHFSQHILPFFKKTKVIITSLSIEKVDSERVKKYPFVLDFLRNPMSVEYLNNLKDTFSNDNFFQAGSSEVILGNRC